MTGRLGEVDLPAPASDRWFEDYVPASVYEFGHASLSEAQMATLARDYDPQSIQTDPAWSATGPFHGVIASCVHTIAICMRLYVDHYISHVASPASTSSAGRDRCDPATACTSASRSPTRGRRAPGPNGDWCTPPSRPSTRTTRSFWRSPR